MTSIYPQPLAYETTVPLTYEPMNASNNPNKKKGISVSPSALCGVGGLVLGGAGGAYAGSKVNPFVAKDGKATDTFTKNVVKNYIASAPEAEQKVYNQRNAVIKGLPNISSADELKSLINTNKDAANRVMSNPEEFLKNVTDENLAKNKQIIKNNFETSNNTFIQEIKNNIQACWNKENQKFEQASSVKQEIFDSIKNSTNGLKTKLMLKYAVISSVVTGIAAFGAYKIFGNKSTSE